MKNHVWVLERKEDKGWIAIHCEWTREEARNYADYYNGFSKGTRGASYRVRKYEAVK
jgi:hypothetical protein